MAIRKLLSFLLKHKLNSSKSNVIKGSFLGMTLLYLNILGNTLRSIINHLEGIYKKCAHHVLVTAPTFVNVSTF